MNILSHIAQSSIYETHSTTANVEPEVAGVVVAGIAFLYIFFTIVSYVVTAILLARIFKKAGIASWSAWVPIYNSWRLLEIGGQQGFWSLLFFVPVLNIVSTVFLYIAMYNIGLKLGKSGQFVLLAIFLTLVWLVWLAVDKSTWNNALGAPSKAPEHLAAPTGTPPTTTV
jgi:hypothetical protein